MFTIEFIEPINCFPSSFLVTLRYKSENYSFSIQFADCEIGDLDIYNGVCFIKEDGYGWIDIKYDADSSLKITSTGDMGIFETVIPVTNEDIFSLQKCLTLWFDKYHEMDKGY